MYFLHFMKKTHPWFLTQTREAELHWGLRGDERFSAELKRLNHLSCLRGKGRCQKHRGGPGSDRGLFRLVSRQQAGLGGLAQSWAIGAGHGTPRDTASPQQSSNGHNGGATVQKLKHFLGHPTAHLAPLALTVIGKQEFYYQPDPRLASHISVITLYICPWQLYILAPSDANPVSLFSCLIPRQ